MRNSQQAINLLNGLEQRLDDYCGLNNEGKAAFRMAITALELFGNAERLPSAQPEIIRCKDCRYYQDNNDGYPHINCKWDANETPDADDFCSGAERRTDE